MPGSNTIDCQQRSCCMSAITKLCVLLLPLCYAFEVLRM